MAFELDYLPLSEDELPVSKLFTIDDEDYTFVFRKNVRHDRIYMEILDDNDNVLYTSRLIYAQRTIHAVVDNLNIESELIPFNADDLLIETVGDTEVTPDNLNRVKIYVLAG